MFERRLYYHIDWPLIIAIIALCSLGVLMIYSTTFDPTRGTARMYSTQLYAIVIGMGDPGIPSRLLASRFGSRWTYAGNAVAAGQVAA